MTVGSESAQTSCFSPANNSLQFKSRRQANCGRQANQNEPAAVSVGSTTQAPLVLPREVITLHSNARLISDHSAGAKRASSAIPKLNLADIQQAPKKTRKNTNL